VILRGGDLPQPFYQLFSSVCVIQLNGIIFSHGKNARMYFEQVFQCPGRDSRKAVIMSLVVSVIISVLSCLPFCPLHH